MFSLIQNSNELAVTGYYLLKLNKLLFSGIFFDLKLVSKSFRNINDYIKSHLRNLTMSVKVIHMHSVIALILSY